MKTEVYELGKAALDIVAANGFDPPTWENVPEKTMMVLTEVDELRDEDYDVEEFGYEIADVFIRLTGLLIGVFGEEWTGSVIPINAPHSNCAPDIPSGHTDAYSLLMLSTCAKAVEAWRKGNREVTMMRLASALSVTIKLGELSHIDVARVVREKTAKNAKRGKFHGKVTGVG